MDLPDLVERAIAARAPLVDRLAAEGTDAYRVFHGAAEGREGIAVDRYGPLVLVQSFREPLEDAERRALETRLAQRFPAADEIAFVARGADPLPGKSRDHVCLEAGARFRVRARHRGRDPWLFLDLRAGRRRLRELCAGRSVLNLFAYTCTAGVAAAAAGASEVWNVDFSRSALDVGRANAERNAIDPERVRFVQEDCLPVLRQLAGLPVKGRGSRRSYARFEPRTFDVVFLDPPAWSKGPFGAVDVERDYASLFKPALLATAPGGSVVATNHLASVDLGTWVEGLRRCAEKAGRELERVETIAPDEDFPARDGRAPLKVAVCTARH
jgi:23S rRNA (cytosine1962-C5)-methyltransferase